MTGASPNDDLARRILERGAFGRGELERAAREAGTGETAPPASISSIEPGAKLGGYTIVALLGTGGMGSVFRARDATLGREVALKVRRIDRSVPDAEERFRREALAASRVTHPNIVRVHATGEERGISFLVTELVEGEGLDALVERSGPLPARRAAEIARRLALALEAIHDAGILHRDMKPANVILDARGEPRLTDFGIARLDGPSSLTGSRQFLGTPTYAPPEQFRGPVSDPRADIYALGATLYELLAGTPPFGGHNLVAVLGAKTRLPAPPSPPGDPLGPALDAICLHCLEPQPQQRFATALELARALEDALAGKRLPAWSGKQTWSARSKLVTWIAFAALLAGVLALGAFGIRPRSAGAPSPEPSVVRSLPAVPDRAPNGRRLGPLEVAAETALRDKARVNLVGERDGVALGDALLDARDALLVEVDPAAPDVLERAESLLELAGRLARQRLEGKPDDPAGHALRAYVALARAGAPRQAFGAGDLGDPAATETPVLQDLAVARSARGAVGARAASLLVELLASPPNATAAREALETAKSGPIDPEIGASLERVLDPKPTLVTFAALLARLQAPGTAALGARELSRFFARLGAPAAFEHPEWVTEAGSVARVLAREGPRAVLCPPVSRQARDLEELMGPVPVAEGGAFDATRAPELDGKLRAALAVDPEDAGVLALGGDPRFGSASRVVFDVLAAARSFPASRALHARFAPATRHGGEDPSKKPEPTKSTHPKPTIDAAFDELDRRVIRDMATDTLLAFARSPLSPLEVERSVRGVAALGRLEVLEADGGELSGERPRIALEALVGMEELVREVGVAALPFRARLRAAAIPGPWGRALAALDLARVERVCRRLARSPEATTDGAALAETIWFCADAAEAAGATRPELTELQRSFVALGLEVARETAVEEGPRARAAFDEARGRLARHRGQWVPGALDALAPTPEDLERAATERSSNAPSARASIAPTARAPMDHEPAFNGRATDSRIEPLSRREKPPATPDVFVPVQARDFLGAARTSPELGPSLRLSGSTTALEEGVHEAVFELAFDDLPSVADVATIDVRDATDDRVLARRALSSSDFVTAGKLASLGLVFRSQLLHEIELRVWSAPLREPKVGSFSVRTPSVVSPDDAAVVTVAIPSRLAPGSKAELVVTLRNTGTLAWRGDTVGGSCYRLGFVEDELSDVARFVEHWRGYRINLPQGTVVPPGESWAFRLPVVAPAPGRYSLRFQMVHDLVHWFGATAEETVVVEPR